MEVIEVPGSDMPCRECLAPQPHSRLSAHDGDVVG